MRPLILIPSLALALALPLMSRAAPAAEPPVVRSRQSGPWSAKETWDAGRAPKSGDHVVVRAGHAVSYDAEARDVIRVVQIAGTLEFARDRNTRLEAGLIVVTANETPTEEGFDCHAAPKASEDGKARPALIVGRPGAPVPEKHTATIRLHYIEGMNRVSCPALICCGGRMDLHGAPMLRTWVKLKKTGDVGTTSVSLEEYPEGWKEGDLVILTGTKMHREGRGGRGEGFSESTETEPRVVRRAGGRDFTGGYPLQLDKALTYAHTADGNFRGEVANLTRNVVVESADPDGVRGHTMYHRHSVGSISYAEFRHLGKKDELGRYSIHFHLCGDTMRGSSVVGASIWDSHNRWITVHGADYLVIRDCVGYRSLGHGFFLEDGTEVNNILDGNLAAVVAPAKTQKDQVIPFDLNRGAGFWWANCRNSFTRNVTAECAEYGYRFDCKKSDDYDPIRPVRQPDGTVKNEDTRVLPFVRFEDNEAHTMRFFCLNLRGVTRPAGGGLDFYSQSETLAREAAEALPTARQPFWVRNLRCWEANWAFHTGTTGVFLDGLDVARSDVAIWRSIMDRSGFRRITTKDMRVNDIHNPISMGPLSKSETERASFGGVSSFADVMPPTTVITSAVREGNVVVVRGSCADTSDVRKVTVNGKAARSTRGGFAEWEIALEAAAGKPLEVSAVAEDIHGHVEPRAHTLRVE